MSEFISIKLRLSHIERLRSLNKKNFDFDFKGLFLFHILKSYSGIDQD